MASSCPNLYINDNGFVFDYATGFTYSLNHTGILILKQLLEEIPLADINNALEKKYGISHETATSDLREFLQQLSSLNLFKSSEAASNDLL